MYTSIWQEFNMARKEPSCSIKYWTWDRHLDRWRKRKANKSVRHNIKDRLRSGKENLTNQDK
jgi:hypothetical protein